MILIPYRAKNPPERFPWVTVALIVTNVLIYACTTRYFLAVRESALEQLAFSHETLNPWRILTAMFLHGDPMHLIGNMLFLWIFGSSVEGRLGRLKFLAIYALAGFIGALAQDILVGRGHPAVWNLGASGAIMGIAGAYLYLFPFAAICVVFILPIIAFFRVRVMEWQARWVVLWFLGFDVLYGLLPGRDGIGHMCHLGGAAAGFLAVLLLRAPRDEEEFSEAQRMRADSGGDYHTLAFHELAALMEGQTNAENVPLILTYCWKAQRRPEGDGHTLCFQTLKEKERLLADQAETVAMTTIVLAIPSYVGQLSGMFLLRLGSRLEAEKNVDLAMRVYRHLIAQDPTGRDTEMALSRLARLTERVEGNCAQAAAIYQEQLRLFPNGTLALDARSDLGRLGTPSVVFSAGQQNGSAVSMQDTSTSRAVASPVAPLLQVPTVPETTGTDSTPPAYRPHYVNSTSGLSLRPLGGDRVSEE
jgi:membrane associated rhomboid family serine protease